MFDLCAGGLNDITAISLWANQQNKGNWNFFSFCQLVRTSTNLESV